MKNNTDEFIEMELEITAFRPESETEVFLQGFQLKRPEKDWETDFLKIPHSDKKEQNQKKPIFHFENETRNTVSADEENNYYCPIDANNNDTKLIYIMSFGSLVFMGILINAIFG